MIDWSKVNWGTAAISAGYLAFAVFAWFTGHRDLAYLAVTAAGLQLPTGPIVKPNP